MSKKTTGSVRPSPTASILGIVAMAVILIFALTSFSGSGAGMGGFMAIFVLVGLAGIVYYIINLSSFSKEDKDKIPVTAEDVIQVETSEEGGEGSAGKDFEERLRKVEALKKDGLITQDEYQRKREEILKEKW